MEEFLAYLTVHSSLALFFTSMGEQLGLPIPALPILLTAGAMVAMGRIHPLAAVLSALAGSLSGDWVWYFLGRTRGARVLQFLCKLSAEKDSCVGHAEGLFQRYGMRTLIVTKFIPGLSSMARAMAGINRVGLAKFSFYDGLASSLHIAALASAGYVFSDQIENVIRVMSRVGGGIILIGLGGLAIYGVYELRRCRCADSPGTTEEQDTISPPVDSLD
jgi:membrane protein DedA with SNARE-associated domain